MKIQLSWLAYFKDACHNLYAAKLRSGLALLGILVGTASVVAMVSGGEFATAEALNQFKLLGTDLLAISINANDDTNANTGRADNISFTQAENLIHADPNILQVAPYTQLFHPVYYQGLPLNGNILGVTEQLTSLVKLRQQRGRLISVLDGYAFYCVVGQDIYQAMQRISFKDPLGQQLQIGNSLFTVVGIAKPWPENNFVYANLDTTILIPILAANAISQYAAITNILFRLSPHADIKTVESHLSATIEREVAGKSLSFRSAKELIAKMSQQSHILTLFLGLIASISLFVGGIGVMNIMLVAIAERRREIGVRLAVGATRADIGALFLAEAVILSCVGGLFGVLIGMGVAYGLALSWHWSFQWLWWPPCVGFLVSMMVGLFFGVYPAYLASRLDPILALRAEI